MLSFIYGLTMKTYIQKKITDNPLTNINVKRVLANISLLKNRVFTLLHILYRHNTAIS